MSNYILKFGKKCDGIIVILLDLSRNLTKWKVYECKGDILNEVYAFSVTDYLLIPSSRIFTYMLWVCVFLLCECFELLFNTCITKLNSTIPCHRAKSNSQVLFKSRIIQKGMSHKILLTYISSIKRILFIIFLQSSNSLKFSIYFPLFANV